MGILFPEKWTLLYSQGTHPLSSGSRLWPFQPSFLEWASVPGMSFAFFFFFYLPVKGEEDPDYMSFPWSVYTFLT